MTFTLEGNSIYNLYILWEETGLYFSVKKREQTQKIQKWKIQFPAYYKNTENYYSTFDDTITIWVKQNDRNEMIEKLKNECKKILENILRNNEECLELVMFIFEENVKLKR